MSLLLEDQVFYVLSHRICKCKKQLFKFSLNSVNASQAHLFSEQIGYGKNYSVCKKGKIGRGFVLACFTVLTN